MKTRCNQKKKDYCIYEIFFCINLLVTTHTHTHTHTHKSRTETHSIKKEETEKKIMDYHQTKIIDRNTRGKQNKTKQNSEDTKLPENKR